MSATEGTSSFLAKIFTAPVTVFPGFSRLSGEMAEKQTQTTSLTEIRLIATLLAPLAMAGAAIVAMREAR
jgi:hypothetical protein